VCLFLVKIMSRKVTISVTIENDVLEACQSLIDKRQLSPVINEMLRNLVLSGDTSQDKVIAIAEEARKPLERKRDDARAELLVNAKGARWIRDRSLRQRSYWVGRCGFGDWDELTRWCNKELYNKKNGKVV